MSELFDDGLCKHDGCALVPVKLEDEQGEFTLASWQCPLCERVYVLETEIDVTGVEVTPLTPRVVE